MQPSFDTWTSMFLFAVAMGLFIFTILISNKSKKNYPIAFLVLIYAIIIFQYVLYWTKFENEYPYLVYIDVVGYYLAGPLLYIYFLNLYKIKKTIHFHFIPAVIFLIPSIYLWLKIFDIIEHSTKTPLVHYTHEASWLMYTHMLIYAVLIFRLIYTHKTIDSEFEKVRKKWAKLLLGLFIISITAFVSYDILISYPFFNAEWDYAICFTLSFSIYAIGFFVYKQPKIFNGEYLPDLFLPDPKETEFVETALSDKLYDDLIAHMDSEKPYRDNELRLVNLADQTGLSTHLISKLINAKSGKNFNQFINDYRLSEAVELLTSDNKHNIKTIYFEVGFNNKTTFYTAFKKKYNCTPSKYRATYFTP